MRRLRRRGVGDDAGCWCHCCRGGVFLLPCWNAGSFLISCAGDRGGVSFMWLPFGGAMSHCLGAGGGDRAGVSGGVRVRDMSSLVRGVGGGDFGGVSVVLLVGCGFCRCGVVGGDFDGAALYCC